MIYRNTDALKKGLEKRLEKTAPIEVAKKLQKGARLVEGTAKESIQRGVKSGRVYTRKGIQHQASASGEPPASDTGFLVANITTGDLKKAVDSISIQVESKAPYSKFLEFGTRNMQPRPFLQPALEKNKRKIEATFKKGGLIK
jgi:HK97 gp10 family phage protein